MKKRKLGLLSTTILCGTIAFAQDNATTKGISIFKNGQSFVVKEASVNTTNGDFKISKLPNALFGTYWFNGLTTPISSVTSKMEDFVDKKERKANSFLELLHANKGMEITVNTTDNQSYKGIVEDFDLPEEINSKMQLQQLQLSNDYEGLYGFDRIFTSAAPVLLLKMSGKWVSIEPSTIKSIEFAQKPSRTTVANITVQKPILTVHFNKSGKQDFRYMYLQSGLSWTPVYKMQLLSETEADLSLQAEVTNTVEDISHTNVDFVVGVPNFSQASGLATLLNFGKNTNLSAAGSGFGQFSNNMADAKAYVTMERAITPAPDASNIVASENEDLYFYTIKDMSLEKGARAQFPLFSQKVKINHFYKCDLPTSPFSNYQLNAETQDDNSDVEDANTTTAGSNTTQNVGHYIEIYNNSNMPFTSGPVLMLQGKNEDAIAQDLLPFIARGNRSFVYVTSAPDIVLKENEKIVSTKRNSKKVDNVTYALITVKGTISIQNSKSKATELKLNKPFTGKMLNASVKYTTTINQKTNAYYAKIGNANQTITLETSIPATNRQTVTYTYQVYVRE